jgi:hypothetical protein
VVWDIIVEERSDEWTNEKQYVTLLCCTCKGGTTATDPKLWLTFWNNKACKTSCCFKNVPRPIIYIILFLMGFIFQTNWRLPTILDDELADKLFSLR